MRIAYVMHTRFPTEKAHGHQVAQVCAALVQMGHDVTIVAPDLPTPITGSPAAYYGTADTLTVRRLPTFHALGRWYIPGFLAFAVSMWSYRRALRKYFSMERFDLLYVRSTAVLPALIPLGSPIILELHTVPGRGQSAFVSLCNRVSLVVCLTSAMRDQVRALGVDGRRLLVEADAVDLHRYAHPLPQADAKRKWSLPSDRPVIGYVGSLVTFDNVEKGVSILIEALAQLKARGVRVFGWIVGGPRAFGDRACALARFRGLTDAEIRIQNAVSAADVPSAIHACDVCVYPAPASDHPYFRRDASPLKLFEYLASGRYVVCADIPPIRDVVSASSIRLVPPGDAASLAEGIEDILRHPQSAAKRTEEGLRIVSEHTWEKRMGRILQILKQQKHS
jgi:glycosyltransferase involved in cell wall biosynthesis